MTGASAPGKVILTGEYAVLDGAPALVAAVDRRATATVVPAAQGITVHAPDLGISATGRFEGNRLRWAADPATTEALALVTAIVEAIAPAATATPAEITVSTAAFFHGATGNKLGLGSSAALTVALAGALAAHWGQPTPTLTELIAVHRDFQSGRGSGTDIAAAVSGGLTTYTVEAAPVPARLPAGVSWSVIFTGRSASTAAMLASLGTWRADHPTEYAEAMTRLAAIAHRIAGYVTPAGSVINNDDLTAAFLDAVDEYARGLDELGRAAGIDIMSPQHRELRNLAAEFGVIYKPSGAGGGDIGIAFSRTRQGPGGEVSGDTNHKNAFREAVFAAGYRMIEVDVDPSGLIVTSAAGERHPRR